MRRLGVAMATRRGCRSPPIDSLQLSVWEGIGVPEVDFAILCRAADAHDNLISLLSGPVDTAELSQTPAQIPLTLVVRFLWTPGELGREHRGEILFQTEDGERLMGADFIVKPDRPPDLPPGWKAGTNLVMTFPLPIPRFGLYAFEILVDDKHVKSLPFRAKPSLPSTPDDQVQ